MKKSLTTHYLSMQYPHFSGKIENVALFLWLDLPSTIIRNETGSFRKRSSKRRNLKTVDFPIGFHADGKTMEKKAVFENVGVTPIMHVISLNEFSSYTNPK